MKFLCLALKLPYVTDFSFWKILSIIFYAIFNIIQIHSYFKEQFDNPFLWLHCILGSIKFIFLLFTCWLFACVQFSKKNYWKDHHFSIIYAWPLCYKLMDCIYFGLFLGCLFYFILIYVYTYANTIPFDYYNIVIQFEIRIVMPPAFLFIFLVSSGYLIWGTVQNGL